MEIASAFISIMPEMKGISSQLQRGLAGPASAAGKTAGGKFGKVFGSSAMTPMKGLVTGMAGLFAAQKITGFFKDSIAEAREAQVVGQRTESVIKSMGIGSLVSAGQIGKLAMSISNKTAVDDEAVQSGQNLLLTFGNIAKTAGESNGVFAQTSQLMVDMSAAMGTDVKSSAIQLGKALNDPVKGVSALTRVGVSFTEQQKEQIKTLVESGKLAKAQGIVLGEVGKQFGGAAASMSTPAERAQVAWANFKEQIGTAFLPVIDKVLSTFSSTVLPAVSGFVAQIQSGTGAGGAFASVFGTLGNVLGTVAGFVNQNRTAFATFLGVLVGFEIIRSITVGVMAFNAALAANPIGIVVVALAALAAGLVYAYKNSETFRNIVNGAFSAIRAVAEPVLKWLTSAVGTTINFVRDHWRLIITILGGPLGLAVALVTKYWDQVKAATTAVWNAVKTIISTEINAAKAVVSTGVSAIQTVFGKIADLVGKVRGWFEDIVTAIRNKFGDAVGVVSGVVDKIKTALSPLVSAFDAIKDAIGRVISAIKSIPSMPDITPGFDLPGIPGLAKGGPVTAGRTYLVGEQGPELFTSSRAGYIVPNHQLSTLSGRSSADVGAKLDKLSKQLEVLTQVSGAQGREFGRELNNAAAHGVRKGR